MKWVARLLVLVAIAVAATVPASGAQRALVCEAAGTLLYGELNGEELRDIEAHGSGSCFGDLKGPYVMTLDGTGVKTPDDCGAAVPVGFGTLAVHLTLTNSRTGKVTVVDQAWQLVFTAPSMVIGVLIAPPSTGTGAIVTRVFNPVRCVIGGGTSPSAVFAFSFLI